MIADLNTGEGILGKIQPLTAGHTYYFSFDWALNSSTNNPDFVNRDFNIYLIHCSSSSVFSNPPSSTYPQGPP